MCYGWIVTGGQKQMKKFIKTIFTLILVMASAVVILVGATGYNRYEQLTQPHSVEQMAAQIESAPGFVPYDQLPEMLVKATVSVEDRRFYEHGGVDYIGIARALMSQLFPETFVQSGGSTITQQTVKNMFDLFTPSITRKVAEVFLAKDLEKVRTKEQILALYVNIINYGDNHIGIREAAAGYFWKEPYELTDAQCTLLAGIPQSPANYQLSDHYDAAKRRQQIVLQTMVDNGYIDEQQSQQIYYTPVF